MTIDHWNVAGLCRLFGDLTYLLKTQLIISGPITSVILQLGGDHDKASADGYKTQQNCLKSRPIERSVQRAVSFGFFLIIFSTSKLALSSPYDWDVLRPDPHLVVQLLAKQFKVASFLGWIDMSRYFWGSAVWIYHYTTPLSDHVNIS